MFWARFGGYLGLTIGLLGWVIGFAIFCAVAGTTQLLVSVALPGTLISLGLATLAIMVLEGTLRVFGPRSPMLQVALWGLLAFLMGLLWFIVNHWVARVIEQHPQLVQRLQQQGSVYQTSDTVPLILLAVGVVLLAVAVFQILRADKATV